MEGVYSNRRWSKALALAGGLALVAGQAWMVLSLFGHSPQAVIDERPLVSGRHPLHLYHGFLGAQSLRSRGSACSYDPAFQAGYPKTPIFDDGSRPAELVLTVAGGACSAAAYKVGIFCFLMVLPPLLLTAARAVGLGRLEALVAAGLALLVWWGRPCQQALVAGDIDILAALVCALCDLAFLIGFDRAPRLGYWVGMAVTGTAGIYANPSIFLVLVPVFLIYYLIAGPRHGMGWHISLFLAAALSIGSNAFWLMDWFLSWWIHLPLAFPSDLLTHRTLRSLWETSLWGTQVDRALTLGILIAGLIGAFAWGLEGRKVAARVIGLACALFLLLALGGVSWPPLARFGTERMVVGSLMLAAIPAAHLGTILHRGLSIIVPSRLLRLGACGLIVGGLGLAGLEWIVGMYQQLVRTEPLPLGLTQDQESIVAQLRSRTDTSGRILWEERSCELEHSCWTALLPVLTGRSYLGGLGPLVSIEHGYARLTDQSLAGRPLRDLSDGELDDFCRRYNVRWIVVWSPANRQRLESWSGVRSHEPLAGGATLLERSPGSYILKGSAVWHSAEPDRITLTNVVPDDGTVVLSLHYHSSLRVSPSRVWLEREPDAADPIPFVRLRLPAPASLVTISTGER
jgi:hypothetical protein